MNDRIHVAVGVIYNPDKDKVLITKRTDKQHLAGFWEFPGGKVETNEDVRTALSRELYEELGIDVISAEQFTTISHDYPEKKVLLDVWKIHEWSGDPVSRENQEIIWSKIDCLYNYEFPAANKHIIQTISLSPVYVISKESYDDYTHLLSVASECFTAGLKLFQLRLKSKNIQNYQQIVENLSVLAKQNNAKLIMNGTAIDIDKYDIDGVHLNANELIKYTSRPISEEYIFGASCHNEKELVHASKLNVNYAFISPVSTTKSHPEQKALGWDNFNDLKRKVNFPVYALGGMTPADLKVAKSHGAYGVAMIGAIWNSDSPAQIINSI
jgi:8-oxo-dGTP diphosphatase